MKSPDALADRRMWTCPECSALLPAETPTCPRCRTDLSGMTPAPLDDTSERKFAVEAFLRKARTDPTAFGPPLLYPEETFVGRLSADVGPRLQRLDRGVGLPLGLLAAVIVVGTSLASLRLPGSEPVAAVLIAVVVAGLLVAGYRGYRAGIRARPTVTLFLTSRRLLLWNPTRAVTGGNLTYPQVIGVQYVPRGPYTGTVRIFRRPNETERPIGESLEKLRTMPGGTGSYVAMAALGLFGPGAAPTDPRLLGAGGLVWVADVPRSGVDRLLAELSGRVPDLAVELVGTPPLR